MGQINNQNDSDFRKKVLDRLDKLERGTPMNNAAIGRGGIEVYAGGVINVSDGNLIVNGTATIDGILNADGTVTLSGTITISGPLTISGDTTVTGNFDVDGPMATTGTLSVEGVTTLKNDLNVTTGGKVNVGTNMTLSPTTDGGAVTFSDGSKLSAGPGAVNLRSASGASSVSAAATSAGVTSGSTTLVVFNDGTWKVGSSAASIDALTSGVVLVSGTLKAANDVYMLSLPNSPQKPNLYRDPATGKLYNSTATI